MTDYTGPDRRRYLAVREVAQMWGVSDDKVRADIRKGALEAYTVGGCIRIRVSDAEAYGRRTDLPSSTTSTR
jgi:excisionase family DNA binding protein